MDQWLATAPKNPIFKNIIDDMLQKLEQYEKKDTDTYQSCKKILFLFYIQVMLHWIY